jgi:catechol 2,3-dioxygenase-like lactoylglutathione lyase family enzyme
LGIKRLDPPPGCLSEGLWFHDCDGTLLEIKAAPKSSPNEKNVVVHPSSPPGIRCAPLRGAASAVRPRRLAHILVFTRDIRRAIGFYTEVLGLRLSDEAGVVAFLHGIYGSDHHMIAFAKSDAPGFHHCSWDVESAHQVGLGAMQMADEGYTAGWGLGRHVLGSNYFHYVRDPWGSYSEYSSDMDFIPVDMDWKAESYAPENGFYLWGPQPPPDFALNHEAAC